MIVMSSHRYGPSKVLRRLRRFFRRSWRSVISSIGSTVLAILPFHFLKQIWYNFYNWLVNLDWSFIHKDEDHSDSESDEGQEDSGEEGFESENDFQNK